MNHTHIPLFPLNAPLLPECTLPLQIFEPRYCDMVSWCLRNDQDFVVVQLREACRDMEVWDASQETAGSSHELPFYSVGTMAHITDFGQSEKGMLAISVTGQERVELLNAVQQKNGLWCAGIEPIAERGEPDREDFHALVDLLDKLLAHDLMSHVRGNVALSSPMEVMNYLVMLLPISRQQKQGLLETDNLSLRWKGLLECIALLEEKASS